MSPFAVFKGDQTLSSNTTFLIYSYCSLRYFDYKSFQNCLQITYKIFHKNNYWSTFNRRETLSETQNWFTKKLIN